jgi:predicted nucleotidyltransferase component of viral defense system
MAATDREAGDIRPGSWRQLCHPHGMLGNPPTLPLLDIYVNVRYCYGMSKLSGAELIECFHLLFLRVLAPSRGQAWFVLKGGANLRYFFESVRYSNDIDLDSIGKEGWQVDDSVTRVLEGAALPTMLRQAKIAVADFTHAKNTETTQGWKLGLARAGAPAGTVRTKIEFSVRGGTSTDYVLGQVPYEIVRPYGLMAPSVLHYQGTSATDQKIAALALRSETKARDVFDLELLFRRRRASDGGLPALSGAYAKEAAQRALEVSYASYRSEVLSFIEPAVREVYEPEGAWDQMRHSVVEELEELAAQSDGKGEA